MSCISWAATYSQQLGMDQEGQLLSFQPPPNVAICEHHCRFKCGKKFDFWLQVCPCLLAGAKLFKSSRQMSAQLHRLAPAIFPLNERPGLQISTSIQCLCG